MCIVVDLVVSHILDLVVEVSVQLYLMKFIKFNSSLMCLSPILRFVRHVMISMTV